MTTEIIQTEKGFVVVLHMSRANKISPAFTDIQSAINYSHKIVLMFKK